MCLTQFKTNLIFMKATLYRFLQTAFLGAALLLWSFNASAQDRRLTGKITRSDGAGSRCQHCTERYANGYYD